MQSSLNVSLSVPPLITAYQANVAIYRCLPIYKSFQPTPGSFSMFAYLCNWDVAAHYRSFVKAFNHEIDGKYTIPNYNYGIRTRVAFSLEEYNQI